jgi:hypothetical protein
MSTHCSDALVTQLEHLIDRHGSNKHKYPFAFGKHNGRWFVVVEVDSPAGTFDIETDAVTLASALDKALAAVERSYTKKVA